MFFSEILFGQGLENTKNSEGRKNTGPICFYSIAHRRTESEQDSTSTNRINCNIGWITFRDLITFFIRRQTTSCFSSTSTADTTQLSLQLQLNFNRRYHSTVTSTSATDITQLTKRPDFNTNCIEKQNFGINQ